ncbi:MAG: hypothetical protein ABSG76_25165 [Xanthobacteraceae bacterium]
MGRAGDIVPETRSEIVDRADEIVPLWEAGAGAPVSLPWKSAAGLTAADVAPRLAGHTSAAVAVGAAPQSAALLDAVLSAIPAGMRIYVYGGPSLGANKAGLQKIARLCDRVLVRLGPEPPADWLVVDGASGLLQLGPPQGDRRWLAPLRDALARSLFNAFCVLFWHLAEREGLPDRHGTFALRPPLAAPFAYPGPDIVLPAGRLMWNAPLPDRMPDADIRVLPARGAPRRAAKIFVPPTADDFDFPQALASDTTKVVWSDVGLPPTVLSVERLIVDLVAGPIGIQLEWPRPDAIAMMQSLDGVARAPGFEFHPRRRLRDVRRAVQLAGWDEPAGLRERIQVDLGDVEAPLDQFDAARPDTPRRAPALALEVEYMWKVVPQRLPANARAADLVRQWRELDEWAKRVVDDCRQIIKQYATADLPDEFAGRVAQLRDELDVAGQTRPSRRAEHAGPLVEQMRTMARGVKELAESVIEARQNAANKAEEQRQRAAWTKERAAAEGELSGARTELEQAVQHQNSVAAEISALDAELARARASLEAQRRADGGALIARANAELAAARRERDDADRAHPGGKAPNRERKVLNKRIEALQQQIAKLKRGEPDIGVGSPPADELRELRDRGQDARKRQDAARAAVRRCSEDIGRLEPEIAKPFEFRPSPRPSAAPLRPVNEPPVVPTELPPELGELLEDQGRRYLAVRAWEQVDPARPVAKRLNAMLVRAR